MQLINLIQHVGHLCRQRCKGIAKRRIFAVNVIHVVARHGKYGTVPGRGVTEVFIPLSETAQKRKVDTIVCCSLSIFPTSSVSLSLLPGVLHLRQPCRYRVCARHVFPHVRGFQTHRQRQ